MPIERDPRKKLGATVLGSNKTHFRVWAPRRKEVDVECRSSNGSCRQRLQRHANGYFTGIVAGVGAGDRYVYWLDGGVSRPDPASRFQPDGVHGDSQIIDPHAYPWQDTDWGGVPKCELIIYELHIGAFTEAGTFVAAIDRLDELKRLGVTAVELMPVAQSPGRWNWGYDGVDLYAVRNTYGTPDELRALVDACHARGIAVILDVVYNHLGPEGNYLADFGPYFSRKHHTPWGEAFNFDGRRSEAVRRFVVDNAIYWLDEYHVDGLRLDAVHFMLDDREITILDELRDAVSQYASTVKRHIHLIAEANVYDHEIVMPVSDHRKAYDAAWCDDLMHSIYTIAAPGLQVTHRHYDGAEDLAEALQHGFIYTGPEAARATPEIRSRLHADSDRPYLPSLVAGLQTHDCVGNHPHGKRLHQVASKEFQKAAAPLVLLYPTIPLMFMGEERAADSPFCFFADFHDQRLRRAVDRGRAREYPHHVWKGAISPTDERAFYNSKCLGSGDESVLAWYRSVIQLRQDWRKRGWLAPQLLDVRCDSESSLFSFRYLVPEGPSPFVLARLVSPDTSSGNLEVQIDGEVILDSCAAESVEQKQTFTFDGNRTLVGKGGWRVLADSQ